MADPLLVEFLNSGISYAIDAALTFQKNKKMEKVIELVRTGEDASYQMGLADGLELAISVLDHIRKQKGDDDG